MGCWTGSAGRSCAPRRPGKPGATWGGCSPPCSARTAGSWPRRSATPGPGAPSGCSATCCGTRRAARDLCRDHAVERLGARDAVLVVDETAFVKKGEHSAGVARQYCGTLGKVENCQVGVFLAYGSRGGHALIDRRLYLPEAWAG